MEETEQNLRRDLWFELDRAHEVVQRLGVLPSSPTSVTAHQYHQAIGARSVLARVLLNVPDILNWYHEDAVQLLDRRVAWRTEQDAWSPQHDVPQEVIDGN